jgi:hypothetical protein
MAERSVNLDGSDQDEAVVVDATDELIEVVHRPAVVLGDDDAVEPDAPGLVDQIEGVEGGIRTAAVRMDVEVEVRRQGSSKR